jgi:N-carbamoyl-L-amino-acid hydrolase
MAMRKDAGAALVDYAYALKTGFERLGVESTVWNLGSAVFRPGAANVVPAAAELIVEFRDLSPEALDRLEAHVHETAREVAAAGPVGVEVERTAEIPPIMMDEDLGRRLGEAAAAEGVAYMSMPSGAGHDAMVMARHVTSGMMFIPSIGGRSHDVAENTSEADIVTGCQVVATAIEGILRSAARTS